MSAVADPPRADPDTHCPRCGADLAPDQDWCLECGAAARTRVVRPPSWRGPVAIVAVLVLLAGAGIALAFVEVTDPGQKPAAQPTAAAAATPAPAPAAAPTTTAANTTPASTAAASAQTTPPKTTPTPNKPAGPTLLTWPKGKAAYTVILLSTADHATARKTAKALAKAAAIVGLAHSDDFTNVPAGKWLVFAGRYPDQAKAQAAAATAKQHGATIAYAQYLTAKR